MSKAKELATKLRDLIKNSNHIVSDGADIMSWDWYDFDPLIDAVLSEPEPLRGWIEEGETPDRRFAHLLTDKVLHEKRGGCFLSYYNSPNCEQISFKESYDSIKQKIRGAS